VALRAMDTGEQIEVNESELIPRLRAWRA
jgi:hypothetical protein